MISNNILNSSLRSKNNNQDGNIREFMESLGFEGSNIENGYKT